MSRGHFRPSEQVITFLVNRVWHLFVGIRTKGITQNRHQNAQNQNAQNASQEASKTAQPLHASCLLSTDISLSFSSLNSSPQTASKQATKQATTTDHRGHPGYKPRTCLLLALCLLLDILLLLPTILFEARTEVAPPLRHQILFHPSSQTIPQLSKRHREFLEDRIGKLTDDHHVLRDVISVAVS